MASTYAHGTAPIKAEYVISLCPIAAPDDDAAEGNTNQVISNGSPSQSIDVKDDAEGNRKGPRNLSGAQRKKLAREEKKKQRGQNKARRFQKMRDELDLCWRIAAGQLCEFGSECRFTHDISQYLAVKPKDVKFSSTASLSNTPPFAPYLEEEDSPPKCDIPSVDFSTTCPIFQDIGTCRHGFKCRFLGAHISRGDNGAWDLVNDSAKQAHSAVTSTELNFIDPDTRKLLRTRKYPQPISDAYLAGLQKAGEPNEDKDDDAQAAQQPIPDTEEMVAEPGSTDVVNAKTDKVPQDDTLDVPMRFQEKKRLHWAGKTYLAPLTTVGNLPFRRLCVSLGADITCGEMGLATSFLSGSKEEWSLVRHHPSESIFGVQIAGNKPANLVPTAEAIARECGNNLDFVDLNCGCPIDLVFKSGSGSALLDSPGKLSKVLVGMNKALGEIPLTVKLRTGVKEGHNTAHRLMPRLASECNPGCITLHGRTRQQRYSKLANWDYIKECVEAVRAREAEENLQPIPIFGGGDCFSSQDYWERIENSGVDGVMIGRGALIKPWIFTEIKERREWDISSRERLELIRRYAEYGLSHFGTDTTGVNTTRRYLCEALSFQYRYVPIGLLEYLPGKINDRPPAYRGRDELETLLASPNSQDWVKISEMFLGPAPDAWNFIPKHKSNAFESQG